MAKLECSKTCTDFMFRAASSLIAAEAIKLCCVAVVGSAGLPATPPCHPPATVPIVAMAWLAKAIQASRSM